MVKVVPSAMRSQISEDLAGLRIVIPMQRNLLLLAFLSFWLCGWFAGECAVSYALVFGKMPAGKVGPTAPFLLAWLGAWTIGGGFAIYAWLNLATGREVIHLTKNELVIRREVLGIARPREYDLAHLAAMRASPPTLNFADPMSALQFWGISGGTIAFDYGSKTYRFGRGLEEAEARQIIEVIQKWLASRPGQVLSTA